MPAPFYKALKEETNRLVPMKARALELLQAEKAKDRQEQEIAATEKAAEEAAEQQRAIEEEEAAARRDEERAQVRIPR